ncbi:MAG: tetratricopeptide repeat protein [Planctomycetota bacterium]|jgi:cytochrome c-type biogenesis protein CcmH/NrfG
MIDLPEFPTTARRTLRGRTGATIALGLAILLAATTNAGTSDLRRGDPAPVISGTSLDGRPMRTAEMRGRPLVLLFGETGHARTRTAFEQIVAALDEPDLTGQPVTWLVILSSHSDVNDVASLGSTRRRLPLMLHDADRAIFRAHEVVVQPSVVVVDEEGRVVHAISGPTERLGDIVHDAVLLACGRLSAERFEQMLHPESRRAPTDNEIHAQRSLRLADRLLANEMVMMAEEKYREAIELDATCVEAHVRLGALLRREGRLDEAESLFSTALALEPDSLEAMCGLAHVGALKGGDALNRAADVAREVVRRDPAHAQGHYVLGLIHQQRGEHEQAAAQFRDAADMLLERLARISINERAGLNSDQQSLKVHRDDAERDR